MTQDEFNKTAFRKGDRVRIDTGTYVITEIDFISDFVIKVDGEWITVDRILEYIPVGSEEGNIIHNIYHSHNLKVSTEPNLVKEIKDYKYQASNEPLTNSTNKHESDEDQEKRALNFIMRSNGWSINDCIRVLKSNGYRVQKEVKTWEDC